MVYYRGKGYMANFNEAYLITSNIEGKYSNDPVDPGGETYKGVARKRNPNWSGWVIVDRYKNQSNFPKNMYSNTQLEECVRSFYKEQYWNINKLDDFSSQPIANDVYDTSVNMGVSKAVKFLQLTLNVLNRNGAVYPDISEDGKMGATTLKALDFFMASGEEQFIRKIFFILRGNYYIELMIRDPSQEKFCRGWLNRINL
jgi:lysozyme family protein